MPAALETIEIDVDDLEQLRLELGQIKSQLTSELGGSDTPGNLRRGFEHMESGMSQRIDGLCMRFAKLEAYLMGTSDRDNPGLLIRIDRIEERQVIRDKQAKAMWAVIAAISAAVIAEIVGIAI